MIGFVILFLTVYTGMHVVFFVRVRTLLPERGFPQGVLVAFLVMMILFPVVSRVLERVGLEGLARPMAMVSYVWMGFLFISFCVFLLVGGVDLIFRLTGVFSGVRLPVLSGKGVTILLLGFILCVWVYGFREARQIRVERVRIQTEKLPDAVDRLKIVQISDVHLGVMVREERLRRIVERIVPEAPDVLVCTGDLVDGDISLVNGANDLFAQVRAELGKFAVTGNHEYYAGLDRALAHMERFGFKVLRGEAVDVAGVIRIVGVDDPAGRRPAASEVELLQSVPRERFTLFLKHRPALAEGSEGLFDLQLSGHTHRGQIFPFRFITGMVYPMQNGLYELAKGSKLYTSRGTGTWGPPIRVLSPPEVTVIELVKP